MAWTTKDRIEHAKKMIDRNGACNITGSPVEVLHYFTHDPNYRVLPPCANFGITNVILEPKLDR